jgi:hypothetical protein
MMNNNNDNEPINIETRMNNHLAASYMAKYSSEIEEPLQTVAYKNLLRIAAEQWQMAVNYSNLIMAFLDARNKGDL